MNPFTYLQPETLDEAAKALTDNKEKAIPYSGGTDALVLLKDDLINPEFVVNLKKIKNLDKIEYTPGKGLRIGALVKIDDIANHPKLKEKYAILSEAARDIASPQLRNMGTVGGNLCQRPRCEYFRETFDCLRKGGDMCYAYDGHNKLHCIVGGGPCYIVHPSDLAVAFLALDAEVAIHSKNNPRTIPISEFYILPEDDYTKETVLQPDEFVKEIIVKDLPEGTRSGYFKFMERAVWDFAVVSLGLVLEPNGNSIKKGRAAFGGVAPKPWLEEKVTSKLNNFTPNEQNINELAERAFTDAEPLEHNEYKIPLSRNILIKMMKRLTV